MAYRALTLGGNCSEPVGAGRLTRMTLDEFEALKMCAAEERRLRRPPSWTFPPLQGISKDLGFDSLDEAIRSRPSTSFLNASASFVNASHNRVCRGPLVSFASAG
jgi:hypothetical protein